MIIDGFIEVDFETMQYRFVLPSITGKNVTQWTGLGDVKNWEKGINRTTNKIIDAYQKWLISKCLKEKLKE